MPKAIESDTTNPVAPATPLTPVGGGGVMSKAEFETIPPLVSCFDLARSLVELWKQSEDLDGARLNFVNNSVKYQQLNKLWFSLGARIDAVDDLILETPATTLQDAAAKILQVTGCLIGDSDTVSSDDLGRCLLDAFYVVARTAGVELESIAFSKYVPASFLPNTLEAL